MTVSHLVISLCQYLFLCRFHFWVLSLSISRFPDQFLENRRLLTSLWQVDILWVQIKTKPNNQLEITEIPRHRRPIFSLPLFILYSFLTSFSPVALAPTCLLFICILHRRRSISFSSRFLFFIDININVMQFCLVNKTSTFSIYSRKSFKQKGAIHMQFRINHRRSTKTHSNKCFAHFTMNWLFAKLWRSTTEQTVSICFVVYNTQFDISWFKSDAYTFIWDIYVYNIIYKYMICATVRAIHSYSESKHTLSLGSIARDQDTVESLLIAFIQR